jgi:hypothetical protein
MRGMSVDEAEAWLGEAARADPERYREVCARFPVLGPVEIRRALAHEVMAGDGVTVEAVAFRYGWRETGRRVLRRSFAP